MKGSDVEVYLNTPLLRFRYKMDGEDKELLEGAIRLSGKILEKDGSGLTLKIHHISNMRVTQSDLPFETVFVPMSKIDFVVVK